MLAPGSDILKVSSTNSTIKEPGKAIVTVYNSGIVKIGTQRERQTPLKMYADSRGPRTSERLVQEKVQSHVKEFTQKLKGNKKLKHKRRDPGNGVSLSRSHIARATRGRIPKLPSFSALRGQHETSNVDSPSQLTIPRQFPR